MAFKIFMALALVAVVSAIEHVATSGHSYQHFSTPQYASAPIAYKSAPVYHHSAPVALKKVIIEEEDAPAHYEFAYAVHDEHTGDVKEQKETRKDDVVEGYYTLNEADGTRRIVHYTANKHDGFNAVVTHEGKPTEAPQVIKAVPTYYKPAPIVYKAAPIAYKSAPIAYKAAPVVYKSAPIAYKAAPSVAYTSSLSHKSSHIEEAPLYHVSFAGPHHQYHY